MSIRADIPAAGVSGKTTHKKSIIPLEALAQHIGILGKTGSGKTTTAKGIAETLLNSGKRICAIDPTGVWWGLRLKADGTSAAYPVVIFGGDHADVALDENSGARLAEIIAEESFSCVIDTSLMTVGARTRLFTRFAEALFRANRKPLYLIIDEAHVFAPQGRVPDPESGKMLHAANNLVSGGRSRGLRITLISQRPAKLHKDSLTQVETLIAMRLIAPQDRGAVEAWIGEWADPKQGREIIMSLPSLARGEGWIWSPEVGMLERVAFPAISTFDSSRAPEDGETVSAPADLASVNIDGIRSALAVEGRKPDKQRATVSRTDIEAAEKSGYERGFKKGFITGRAAGIFDSVEAIQKMAESSDSPETSTLTQEVEAPKSAPKAVVPITRGSGGAELRILRVLAARHPARFSKAQWATLSGMKRTGGTWQTYVSRLRTAGYIDENDGHVFLTAAGLAAAGNIDKPPPGSVVAQWKNALGSGPSKIIDVVLAAYPGTVDRANIADRVGMVASGGTFQTYLSRLKSNGLIEVIGRKVKASSTLFMDAEQAA